MEDGLLDGRLGTVDVHTQVFHWLGVEWELCEDVGGAIGSVDRPALERRVWACTWGLQLVYFVFADMVGQTKVMTVVSKNLQDVGH